MFNVASTTKTLICIGTGGVGKTTMAASIGVGLATSGKKILVLTIDPSQRLAQALGIKRDGKTHKVKLAPDAKGELWSCVIDHQKSFEEFLRVASGNKVDIDQLLQNKLYQQLSTKLNGSQEFTSLINLYKYSSSGEFDLVILDTPPAQHTWNFLNAPEKISALFNEGIASWFRQSDSDVNLFKKILNVGTTQVLKALQLLTGSQFMKELSAFFSAIHNWQGPLSKYMSNCQSLLTSFQTEFVLVTALDSSRINESQKLAKEIQKQGYKLSSVIVNRVPEWIELQKLDPNDVSRVSRILNYYALLTKEIYGKLTQLKKTLVVYKCSEIRQNGENVDSLVQNFKNIQQME